MLLSVKHGREVYLKISLSTKERRGLSYRQGKLNKSKQ